MLGGGNFVTQNKVLPGTYINIVTPTESPDSFGERGRVAVALPLDWGPDGKIFEVSQNNFDKNCLSLFGFKKDSSNTNARNLRELFRHASVLYCYKLMNNGVKASLANVATAKYCGSGGNNISIEILATTTSAFTVNVYWGTSVVFSKTTASINELENDYVDFSLSTLVATEKTTLTGGSNGSALTVSDHNSFLDASESYSFDVMICPSTDASVQAVYIQECKDMRDTSGIKYQLVVYSNAANYEGVINVINSMDVTYWVAGALAECSLSSSITNMEYDGELSELYLPVDYSRNQLEMALNSGKFMFHRVGTSTRVLEDINSLTSFTDEKGEDFKHNQMIRVIDYIAIEIANIFNSKYLGKIPNDDAGRTSLWNDIVTLHKEMEKIRAIENFKSNDVTIEPGDNPRSVVVTDLINVISSMSQLYMTIYVQ